MHITKICSFKHYTQQRGTGREALPQHFTTNIEEHKQIHQQYRIHSLPPSTNALEQVMATATQHVSLVYIFLPQPSPSSSYRVIHNMHDDLNFLLPVDYIIQISSSFYVTLMQDFIPKQHSKYISGHTTFKKFLFH